jgi:hypothetical protein
VLQLVLGGDSEEMQHLRATLGMWKQPSPFPDRHGGPGIHFYLGTNFICAITNLEKKTYL